MLTIGTTYYNNPDYLIRFVKLNLAHVDYMIIVDDGSNIPVPDSIKPSSKIRIFRVKKDYGFNSHGCRNLIMKQTTTDWNILLDVDREFIDPLKTFRTIKTKLATLDPHTLYRFIAHANPDESHISVNDYLIHKSHFFEAGGYDEEIIGERWGDREYFEQLLHFGSEKILDTVHIMLTRPPSMQIKGNSRSNNDKMVRNGRLVDLIRQRILNPDPQKPILTFDWEELF